MVPLQVISALISFWHPSQVYCEFRLITDLSFPRGESVNDLIPDSEVAVSYAGIPPGSGPSSQACQRGFPCEVRYSAGLSLAEELGVPIAPNITEGPATSIILRGFVVDSVRQELRLPPDKISKARSALLSWLDV